MKTKFSKTLNVMSLFGLLGCLSACTTFSKQECLNMNWEQIGYKQGNEGRPSLNDTYNHYAKTCGKDHNIQPDRASLEKGYKAGLQNYCTEDGGARAGSMGLEYLNVCEPSKAPQFLKTYKPARLAWLEKEYANLQNENARLRSTVTDLENKVISLQGENSSLQSRPLSCP